MASVKGIIVEIGGDTSKLQEALKKVNSSTASLSKELRGINSLLKLDPKNTELVSQKQQVLKKNIEETSKKLEELRTTQQMADETIKNGGEISEKEYRNLQREIINTENKLKQLKLEASNWTQAGRKIEEWGNKITNISDKISKIGTTLTTTLTLPIAGIITAGIKYNAEIEKMTKSYETFLGNAEEASKVVNEIQKNASKTPFDASSLIKANQMLISTGENADASQKTILALGDAITATGGGNDELTRMASNLQQIKNAGKATAMDIRQFAYAGIDVYGLLADYTGKTTEEIKDMEISYEDLSGALQKASQDGGKYFNAMNKASETTEGQVKQLKVEAKEMTGALAKSLMPEVKRLLGFTKELIGKFDNLSDEEKKNITNMLLFTAAVGPTIKILGMLGTTTGKVTTNVGKLFKAIGEVKTGTEATTLSMKTLSLGVSALSNPFGQATLAVTALCAAYVAYRNIAEAEMKKSVKEVNDQNKAWQELQNTRNTMLSDSMAEISYYQKLEEELKKITDENGKVKEGYKDRANFILGELNNALGTEYKLNGDIIESYQNLGSEIDTLIAKKKAEATLNAYNEEYVTAKKKESEATQTLIDLQKQQTEALIKYQTSSGQEALKAKIKYEQLSTTIEKQVGLVSEYGKTVIDYEKLQEASVTGSAEAIDEALKNISTSYQTTTSNIDASLTDQISTQAKSLEIMKENLKSAKNEENQYLTQVFENQVNIGQKQLKELENNLFEQTKTIERLTPEQIQAWKNIGEQDYNGYIEKLSKLPEGTRQQIESATGIVAIDTSLFNATGDLGQRATNAFEQRLGLVGVGSGKVQELGNTIKNDNSVSNATAILGSKAQNELDNNLDGKKSGSDFVNNLVNGLWNMTTIGKVTNAAKSIAGIISDYLHHSTPEKGPLKDDDEWMSDFINNMALGILDNKTKVTNATSQLAQEMRNSLNIPLAQDFGKFQGSINNQIIDSTKTVFTTPQIVFNVQELDKDKLEQCFNYVNKKFGSQY